MLTEFCRDIRPWADIARALPLRIGNIDVITYKYVIKRYYVVLFRRNVYIDMLSYLVLC